MYPVAPVSPSAAYPPADARILHLFVSLGHNFVGHFGREPGRNAIVELSEAACRAGQGLEGDRYFRADPGAKGQITFFAMEVHRRLVRDLGGTDRSPAAYRRNVVTLGLDLNALIGVEFMVQGVRFFGTEESRPCDWMERAVAPGARAALAGHGGLRARILTDGILRPGPANFSRVRPAP